MFTQVSENIFFQVSENIFETSRKMTVMNEANNFASVNFGQNLTIFLFRYPFYMAGVIDFSSEVLTWLRYTVWIPLYPLGFFSEGEFK